jgi:hypothetical protein
VFLWIQRLIVKNIHKGIFSVYGGKGLSRKTIHTWADKLSQERSKVAYDARPGRLVETATEAAVQRVEELIRADRTSISLVR